ncbi:MAG: lipoyl synthase, partial [Coriobacteriia bacterium]|nr:lipoyl synthase [Coriobacteriia bacterium]
KQRSPHIRVKSGIMLGLGETKEQVIELFDDLLQVGCELLTIGQYLAPSLEHHQVVEFLDPSAFDEYGKIARERGFAQVASAPLVRSSYRAGEYACA